MSIRDKLNRSLGLENDAPTVEINVDVDEAGVPLDGVDLDGTPTPEVDEAEMLEAANEIEAEDDEIEELEEAQATLESLHTLMREDYQNGGMSPESARFAAIAVESISLKYGITAQEAGISLESYAEDRNSATIVSMEGVKDFISNIVRTIVEKIKELMKKIADFYHRNLSGAAGLKRRAEALKKKARNTTGTKMKENKLDDKGLFSRLNIGGDAPDAGKIITAIKSLGLATKAEFKEEDLESTIKGVLVPSNWASETAMESAAGDIKKDLSNKFPAPSAGGSLSSSFEIGGTSTNGTAFNGNGGFPGNKAIGWGVSGTTAANTIVLISRIQAGVFTDNPKLKADKSIASPALSLSKCEDICDAVIDNMSIVITNAQKKKDGLKVIKVIEKAGNDIIRDIDDDAAAEQRYAAKLLNTTTHVYRVIQSGQAQIAGYNMTLCKAALSYAARSINNFEKA